MFGHPESGYTGVRKATVAVWSAPMKVRQPLTAVALAVVCSGGLSAAPVPRQPPKSSGILVLDDCDPKFDGKGKYDDHLTLFTQAGREAFRLGGFNNHAWSDGHRMMAADAARKCVWVIGNVEGPLRRIDLESGKETLSIPKVVGPAVAVDPETGNVWAVENPGQLGQGKTVVYDPSGKHVVTYKVSGGDIVYDRKAKAFWIAEEKLTKITAAGEVAFSVDLNNSCDAASVDVDATSGAAWVAVPKRPRVAASGNVLLKFDADGKELLRIDLGDKPPARVSADPTDGGVWVTRAGESVERFSAKGKSEVVHTLEALAVQVDPAGGDIWVVTPTEVLRMTAKGVVAAKAKLDGKTPRAWIAAVE